MFSNHPARGRRGPSFVAALLGHAAAASSATAAGEVITVNTVADVTDFAAPQQVVDLPGPDGRVSMREAIAAANNTPGPQTIAFAIPTSEWWLMLDRALLENEGSAWYLTDDFTTIDFTTQTAFTGDTNPTGNEVGVFGTHPSFLGQAAITINADHCVVKGLDRVMQRGYGVHIFGNHNRVVSSTISGPLYAAVAIEGGFFGPPAANNIVGGTTPGEGNRLSAGNAGVRIDGPSQDNVVIGNVLTGSFFGAQVRSATCCPGIESINNRIGGPTPAERNIISGAGKFGEEGFPDGGQVSIEYATGTIIEGNFIGTTADGAAPASPQRGPHGIELRHAPATVIRNNLISGIKVMGVDHFAGQLFGVAIEVSGGSAGSIIQGNRIGVQADSLAPLPNRAGITLTTFPGTPAPANITIGGVSPGQGNLIAFNDLHGIRVASSVKGVPISGNSIVDNGQLGIDLLELAGAPGVTPNDLGDGDDGGNRLQNFPELISALTTASGTTVQGTLNSTPATTFILEFFSSDRCDPTGFGEGVVFLGFMTVTTNGAGDVAFSAALPATIASRSVVTATATNAATGDTSEFSACIPVGAGSSTSADLNGDGLVGGLDLALLLGQWTGSITYAPCPPFRPADLNQDCRINGLDLAVLLGAWG